MKNKIENINLILSEITENDIEKAKEVLDTEEYLENICKEHDLRLIYDEYSNDFEGK